jgi:hypothetical protein
MKRIGAAGACRWRNTTATLQRVEHQSRVIANALRLMRVARELIEFAQDTRTKRRANCKTSPSKPKWFWPRSITSAAPRAIAAVSGRISRIDFRGARGSCQVFPGAPECATPKLSQSVCRTTAARYLIDEIALVFSLEPEATMVAARSHVRRSRRAGGPLRAQRRTA